MKIICPGHNGLMDVPDKDISDAFKKRLAMLVIHCPVCDDEVIIQNIQTDTKQPG